MAGLGKRSDGADADCCAWHEPACRTDACVRAGRCLRAIGDRHAHKKAPRIPSLASAKSRTQLIRGPVHGNHFSNPALKAGSAGFVTAIQCRARLGRRPCHALLTPYLELRSLRTRWLTARPAATARTQPVTPQATRQPSSALGSASVARYMAAPAPNRAAGTLTRHGQP